MRCNSVLKLTPQIGLLNPVIARITPVSTYGSAHSLILLSRYIALSTFRQCIIVSSLDFSESALLSRSSIVLRKLDGSPFVARTESIKKGSPIQSKTINVLKLQT